MSKLIKPMTFLKMNQCPHCKGKLELVEEETYISNIDSTGIPIGGESYVDSRLRCRKCAAEFTAMKKGMHYFIAPSTPQEINIMGDYNPFYQ